MVEGVAELLPGITLLAALLQPLAIVGAAVIAFRMGRGAAEQDRVRAVEERALNETRSWLLDVIDVIHAAAERDWRRVRRIARRLEDALRAATCGVDQR